MSTVIAISNQKGGAGKTTSTIEIANNLAVYEKSVLVIDLDWQANLSKYVGVDLSKPTIYEVLHGKAPVLDAIQTTGRFDTIAGSESLTRADREFIDVDDVYLLSDLVELIQDKYQYILIDAGPSKNILIQMTYVACDYVIIPTIPDDGGLEGVSKVYSDLIRMREGRRKISHAQVIAMILTDYHSTYNNDNKKLENLLKFQKEMEEHPAVFTVRTFTGCKECKSLNMSIMDYDKNSTAAIDFRDLTYDLIEILEG